MTSVDLSTSYLGLKLANPFMTGASPLGDHLDTVRQLEDAGCAAHRAPFVVRGADLAGDVRPDSSYGSARPSVLDRLVVFS